MNNKKQKTLYSWVLINSSVSFLVVLFMIIFSIFLFNDDFLSMSPFVIGPFIIILFIIFSTIYLSKKYSKSKKCYQYTKSSNDKEWEDLKLSSIKKQNLGVFHLLNIYILWSFIIIILSISNIIGGELPSWKIFLFIMIYIIITIINYGTLYITYKQIKEVWK